MAGGAACEEKDPSRRTDVAAAPSSGLMATVSPWAKRAAAAGRGHRDAKLRGKKASEI